jgi:hypothetical protein
LGSDEPDEGGWRYIIAGTSGVEHVPVSED